MKTYFATLLLVATALCAPAAEEVKRGVCKPGTYSCTPDKKGWQVCNVNGVWVPAGVCGPGDTCFFYPVNQSPYCLPPGFTIP